MRKRVTGIQRDGLFVGGLRGRPVPVEKVTDHPSRGLTLGDVWTAGDGMCSRISCAWPHLQWRRIGIDWTCREGVRQPSPRQRVLWVEFGGASIVLHGSSVRPRGQLVPEMPPAQVQIVGFHTLRLTALECAETIWRQAQSDLLGDGGAQLPLEFEDAAWLAVERRRPDLNLVAGPE